MRQPSPAKPFTGRHMAFIMVTGFGIVMAVNFTMAAFAIGGFQGVVVENSYVASQQFNGWLEDAEKSRALGWQVNPARASDGHVELTVTGVPDGAVFSAALRRPLGDKAFADLTFRPTGDSTWRSDQPITPGRWLIRLAAEVDGKTWAEESEI
jgi:nitrogen fixation protein FixH